MSTNEQPHAPVTEEMRELAKELYPRFSSSEQSVNDYERLIEQDAQLLADFCAKREAGLIEIIHGESKLAVLYRNQADSLRIENAALTARISFLTASNEDLHALATRLAESCNNAQNRLLYFGHGMPSKRQRDALDCALADARKAGLL